MTFTNSRTVHNNNSNNKYVIAIGKSKLTAVTTIAIDIDCYYSSSLSSAAVVVVVVVVVDTIPLSPRDVASSVCRVDNSTVASPVVASYGQSLPSAAVTRHHLSSRQTDRHATQRA